MTSALFVYSLILCIYVLLRHHHMLLYLYFAAVAEYVPSENDALDNAVMQQWTRNRVFIPTLSTIATRRHNQHRLVDHLHRMFV